MKRLKLILLIDDDETTNYLNKRLLERLDIAETIDVVTNGEEALLYLRAIQNQGLPLPDLIFLDIQMPVMDGFEFLDTYQRLPQEVRDRMVVTVLSSSASFNDLTRVKQYASVERHISKPLKEETVQEVLQANFSK